MHGKGPTLENGDSMSKKASAKKNIKKKHLQISRERY